MFSREQLEHGIKTDKPPTDTRGTKRKYPRDIKKDAFLNLSRPWTQGIDPPLVLSRPVLGLGAVQHRNKYALKKRFISS